MLGVVGFIFWVLGARYMLYYGAFAALFITPLWLFVPLIIGSISLLRRKYQWEITDKRYGAALGLAVLGTIILLVPSMAFFVSLNERLTEHAVDRFIHEVTEQDGISNAFCVDEEITPKIVADFSTNYEIRFADRFFNTHEIDIVFDNGSSYYFYVSYGEGCWDIGF